MSVIENRTAEECGDALASDQQLLQKFINHRDELAFAELVARHGGLVLGVCRRVLRDEHGAEDAFQATFLVLARRADRIRSQGSLPGWLYAVAYRTAKRASARRCKRREEELRDDSMVDDDSLTGVTSRHEQQLLDEEINSLPAKYRDPLVLHCLMGKSNKQVAAELDLSVGAVEGRLKRGKERLRMRLVKRGVGLSVVVAVLQANQSAVSAAVTESLVVQTVQSAALSAGGGASAYSETVTQLVEQELAMMTTSTLLPATLTAALIAVGLTVGLVGHVPTQTARADGVAVSGDAGGAESGAAAPVRFTAADETGDTADETDPFGGGESDLSGGGIGAGAEDADGGFGFDFGGTVRRESIPIEELPEDIAIRMMKYNSFQMNGSSPSEEKIFASLDETTTLEFIETPLSDVADYLEDLHGIPIEIDTKSLDLVGVGTDSPITRNLKGITFRSALKLMLRDLELAYVVRDEVLQITTQDAAEAMMETRVYTLAHFDTFDSESLASVVQSTIHPDSWRTEKGDKEERRAASLHALPGCLVVTQNQQAHEEIVDLLQQLHRYEGHTRGREKLLEEARQRKREN